MLPAVRRPVQCRVRSQTGCLGQNMRRFSFAVKRSEVPDRSQISGWGVRSAHLTDTAARPRHLVKGTSEV